MTYRLTIAVFAALAIAAGWAILRPEQYPGTTVHLAGDSTMAPQLASSRPGTGWGEPFASMLCEGVRVINHARNGRSTKSFLSEGLWQSLTKQIRAGDIVMIQFGHNDQKIAAPNLYASPWQDYRDNLQNLVTDARTLGAEPVLLTSIARRAFNSQGTPEKTLGDYPEVTRAVAAEMDVKLIDLNSGTHQLLAEMGPKTSKQLYLHLAPGTHANYAQGIEDNTHLNSQGAWVVATLVADDLVDFLPDLICITRVNDAMAIGGLRWLSDKGIETPRQVAVAGFNGTSIGQSIQTRLTTLDVPRREIGRQAALSILA